MLDLMLLSVPYTASFYPPAAPGILQGMAHKHGFTTDYIDWNIQILKSSPEVDKTFRDFCISYKINDMKILKEETQKIVDRVVDKNPKFLGISVFTYNCLPITKLLCLMVKTQRPSIKIILGGQGLSSNGINSNDSWGSTALQTGLCDHWIKSEGEYNLIDILQGKIVTDGQWKQIENLDLLPNPDYKDYNWSAYKPALPVTASRGCVRKCTFCDIHQHWKRFVYRDGISVANEIIEQSQKYNMHRVKFTDSLVNGSMKAYRNMVKKLAEYNATAQKKITWSSQAIFRPVSQMTDEDWRITALSGGYDLSVGIESFSEEIRDHMQKKFSNQDIVDNLKIMQKYKIQCEFLMIVGYVIETQKHIDESKEMMRELLPFANNTITNLQFGSTLGILPGTPLESMYGNHIIPGDHENNWRNIETGSTLELRMHWLNDLKSYAKELGFNVQNDTVHQSLVDNFGKVSEW